MNWLFFAFLAPAIYAFVVLIDKYILSKEITDYQGLPIFTSIMGFIAGIIILIITRLPFLGIYDTAIVLIVGILTVISFVFYYKAISTEEASNINFLFQMQPVMVLVASFLFFSERVDLWQFVGFMLIFTAVIGVSYKKSNQKKGYFSPAFFNILIYDILWAISALLMKFSLTIHTLSQTLGYQSIGVGIGGIIIYLSYKPVRIAFHKTLKKVSKSALLILLVNELIFIFARSITYFAYSLGSVSIVSVLEGMQIFYGIVYGILLTLIIPKIIKEDIQPKTLVKKGFFGIILLIGAWLITL